MQGRDGSGSVVVVVVVGNDTRKGVKNKGRSNRGTKGGVTLIGRLRGEDGL